MEEDRPGAGETDDSPAEGGTYTLLIDLRGAATVAFGAAGDRDLAAGRYAYTGSALGPGGFSRVDRHGRVAAGDHDAGNWHVDHLLGHPAARLADDVRSPGVDAECDVAGAVASADAIGPVPGVGATDCDCGSHLAFASAASALERAVHRAHDRARSRAV